MIEAQGLTKHYGEVTAVDGLTFEVHPGLVTGFLGPNGSGKSTTMRMVMGLDRPNAGSVTVDGRPYGKLPWPLREVGALLEAKAIHPGRSAYNHLWCLAQTNDIPRSRVDEVLDLVGLQAVARKRAGTFSLGMGQRLGIAAALLGDPGVLLFDEADALFGKRSEAKDANDRYANIEVAYLLQQMEQFNGLAVLSTNLRANIDEAFVRRLDAIVEFSLPDEALRRVLWERCCSPELPLADDVDFDFCARAFELSGGSIRSIVVGAAYAAAHAGRAVGMADLVRCTQREYAKLGRLCTEADFGAYWSLLQPAVDG